LKAEKLSGGMIIFVVIQTLFFKNFVDRRTTNSLQGCVEKAVGMITGIHSLPELSTVQCEGGVCFQCVCTGR